MSFFQKLAAFFGLAGVKVVSEDGTPLTDAKASELEGTLQFHQLLNDEQANIIAEQRSQLAATSGDLQTALAKIDALEAKFATLEAKVEGVTGEVKAVAQGVNKMKGAPIVQQTAEDKAPEFMIPPVEKPENDAAAVARLLGNFKN